MSATATRPDESSANTLLKRFTAIPLKWRFVGFITLLAIAPLFTNNNYILRILGNVCMFSTLAVALNVVVGYAGLLDLGFVAFFGLGAYLYGLLSSPQLSALINACLGDRASAEFLFIVPGWFSLIVVALVSVGFGLSLGSPSLRLSGDYLAIVTLGFGLIFVQLSNTLDRVEFPGCQQPLNLTGGANGLLNIEPLRFFGFELQTVTHYFYALLIWMGIVLIAVHRLNQSRLGRAWRSMGEDALAAEIMGMPTRRLKLLAFATGSAISGVTGGIFAAWQGSAFPQNFSVDVLINMYAMMVLGGIGNLAGSVLGASVLSIIPELLRSPELIRMIFYVGLGAGLMLVKPRRNGLAVLIGVIVFGLIVKWIVGAAAPDLLSGPTLKVAAESISTAFERFSQQFGIFVQGWILLLKDSTLIGNLAFVVLVPALIALSRLKASRLKLIVTVPVLYLLAFVWESRLTAEPAVTRLLLVGSLLVVMMIFRPHGLLGQRKVEIA